MALSYKGEAHVLVLAALVSSASTVSRMNYADMESRILCFLHKWPGVFHITLVT